MVTLDPLSHYGSYFMPAAERFLDGFLPWAAADLAVRRVVAPETGNVGMHPRR